MLFLLFHLQLPSYVACFKRCYYFSSPTAITFIRPRNCNPLGSGQHVVFRPCLVSIFPRCLGDQFDPSVTPKLSFWWFFEVPNTFRARHLRQNFPGVSSPLDIIKDIAHEKRCLKRTLQIVFSEY